MKERMKSILGGLSQNAPDISFDVRFWDRETVHYGAGEPTFNLIFKTKSAAKRVFTQGALGFGEEYVGGNITVEGSFQQLLRLGVDPSYQNLQLPILSRFQTLWYKARTLNTPNHAARNITRHYDRGNEFFSLWLDESMTYSCAYFRGGTDTLEQAQQQKYEHVCRKLLLKQGDTLVDIGCGWGGMLMHAARSYGVRGIGCTLSRQQYEYAVERVKREGLENNVQILLADYRSLSGQFDKLVSIGMFEHVGKRFMPTFMKKVKSILKLGGIGLLHTIGKERETPVNSWTLRYIFPGGYIPAAHEILREMGEAGLHSTDMENLRLHYAKTLDEWSRRFEMNVERIRSLFDESFVRMWRMFLNGSSVGFRFGDSRLYQICFTNGINNDLPVTRDHIYHHD